MAANVEPKKPTPLAVAIADPFGVTPSPGTTTGRTTRTDKLKASITSVIAVLSVLGTGQIVQVAEKIATDPEFTEKMNNLGPPFDRYAPVMVSVAALVVGFSAFFVQIGRLRKKEDPAIEAEKPEA